MKKALIAYFSQGGTTEKIATEIANGLKDKEYLTDLYSIVEKSSPPSVKDYDLIGVGAPAYIARPPFNVMAYVKNLPNLNGLPFFVFILYGIDPGTTGNILRKALTNKGGREVGYSNYKGADKFAGYLQRGVFFSPDNPSQIELDRARQFGHDTVKYISDNGYAEEPKDSLPPAVFSFERFLTMKFLSKYFYSYFFHTDKEKCSSCGLCVKNCPQQNITLDPEGMPRWGQDCIMCFYCELNCPEEAVKTPVGWPVFSPLINYNIYLGKKDPSVDWIPVEHRKGKTKRL
jgi:flavodoxin/ferredoxin